MTPDYVPPASSSPISNAYLTGLYEQQVLTKMTELMAKEISFLWYDSTGNWAEVQNEFRRRAEKEIK